MNGYEAFEMMKKGKIVCIKDCENLGYRIKNGFIVEQDLVIEDEPLHPVYFDFDLPYDVFNEKILSLKRNLSYDCEAFITKFENERKKNYPDVVENEENKECLEKILDLAIE